MSLRSKGSCRHNCWVLRSFFKVKGSCTCACLVSPGESRCRRNDQAMRPRRETFWCARLESRGAAHGLHLPRYLRRRVPRHFTFTFAVVDRDFSSPSSLAAFLPPPPLVLPSTLRRPLDTPIAFTMADDIVIDKQLFHERLNNFVSKWKADKRSGDATFNGAGSIASVVGKASEPGIYLKPAAFQVSGAIADCELRMR